MTPMGLALDLEVPLSALNVAMMALHLDVPVEDTDPAMIVAEFVTDRMEDVGGLSVLSVDDKVMKLTWDIPIEDYEVNDPKLLAAVHMVQSGILLDPLPLIIKAAYNGRGTEFAQALWVINRGGFDQDIVERDACLLAQVAPFLMPAWITLSGVLMVNQKVDLALLALNQAERLDPMHLIVKKNLAILLTVRDSDRAMKLAGEAVLLSCRDGGEPDDHLRLVYGFALKAAGKAHQASLQFETAVGISKPKMTPRQWSEWGYLLVGEELMAALQDPARYKPDGFS